MSSSTSSKDVKQRRGFAIPILIILGLLILGVAVLFLFRPKSTAGEISSSERVLANPDPGPVIHGMTMGDPNAPVVIEEFSDFQCGYCRQFFQQTEPALIEKYVATGKVYFIYRTLGDWLGPGSQLSAEASYCASEQDMFWEYHDTLFENQGRVAFSSDNLLMLAEGTGLDMNAIRSCVESYKYRPQVIKDKQDGLAAGVRGTPSFLINGKLVVGAQPFSVFQREIEAALASVGSD